MISKRETHLHPIGRADALDSRFRRFVQHPGDIISNFILPGMNVLDLGCGTGYFTTEIAKRLDDSGKVIAADVQQGMLDILARKIKRCPYQQRIEIYHCRENTLGLKGKFDFILAFYSFHEMEYLDNIIKELQQIAKPRAKILVAEQKFHVSKRRFCSFVEKLKMNKFRILESPNIFLSRAVLMEREH